jgi:hypothetical protein
MSPSAPTPAFPKVDNQPEVRPLLPRLDALHAGERAAKLAMEKAIAEYTAARFRRQDEAATADPIREAAAKILAGDTSPPVSRTGRTGPARPRRQRHAHRPPGGPQAVRAGDARSGPVCRPNPAGGRGARTDVGASRPGHGDEVRHIRARGGRVGPAEGRDPHRRLARPAVRGPVPLVRPRLGQRARKARAGRSDAGGTRLRRRRTTQRSTSDPPGRGAVNAAPARVHHRSLD